jgi:RimJ/RimL family protein N-acetyltransferase
MNGEDEQLRQKEEAQYWVRGNNMKVVLKVLAARHLDALYSLENDPEVLASIPGEYPLSRAAFDEKRRRQIEAGLGKGQSTFMIIADKVAVGCIGHFHRDVASPAEVGYFVGRQWWGRGIATRALVLCLDEMRTLGVSGPVHAGHAVDNLASGRVLRKAGFEENGTTPYTKTDGSVVMDQAWVVDL